MADGFELAGLFAASDRAIGLPLICYLLELADDAAHVVDGENIVGDDTQQPFIKIARRNSRRIAAVFQLRVSTAVVVIGGRSAAGVFDVHGAAAVAAAQQAGKDMLAARRAAGRCFANRCVVDGAPHAIPRLAINDRLVAVDDDPVRFWLSRTGTAVFSPEHDLTDTRPVGQQLLHGVWPPGLAAAQYVLVVELLGDTA